MRTLEKFPRKPNVQALGAGSSEQILSEGQKLLVSNAQILRLDKETSAFNTQSEGIK